MNLTTTKPMCGALPDPIFCMQHGIIGRWLFNENSNKVVDLCGSFHGTLTGGYTWAGSKMGGGVKFNGSSGYLNVGSSTRLCPPAMSFMAWIYMTSLPASWPAGVINRRVGNGAISYQLTISTSGKLAVYVDTSGGLIAYDGTGSFTLSANTLYSVAFTYSSSSGIKGYVNAVLDNSVSPGGTIDVTAADTNIGRDNYNGGGQSRYFPGIIDQAIIANRVWAQNEVIQFYRNPWCGLITSSSRTRTKTHLETTGA